MNSNFFDELHRWYRPYYPAVAARTSQRNLDIGLHVILDRGQV
jgi:hypothetical protein